MLVFLDAGVRLAPQALAGAVGLLRDGGLDLVSPYPRQLAETATERLLQPLLTWSWLTALPVPLVERSRRESFAAASGQLIAVDAAAGSVLVFLDAGVRLAPQALAAAVGLLRDGGLDLLSPYPRQLAETAAERLLQPLLTWSWLTALPGPLVERSRRESFAAASGQLIAVDTAAYRAVGGHAAARDRVLDDLALMRAVKRSGGRAAVADGSRIAGCRRYTSWSQVRDGYATSLWEAFGSPAGAAGVMAGLVVLYVVPPVAALRGSSVGLAGYLAAVAGRYVIAERTGGRSMPDCLAHPASVVLLGWLTADSWRRQRRGSLGMGS